MRKARRYDYDYGCPVEAAFDVIGGKWKGVILFHLMSRTIRFNEFRRLLPGVTQRMLTLQLRELEQDGVVHREVFCEVPPKVEYSLTELGASLKDVINPMRDWGAKYASEMSHRHEPGDTKALSGLRRKVTLHEI